MGSRPHISLKVKVEGEVINSMILYIYCTWYIMKAKLKFLIILNMITKGDT